MALLQKWYDQAYSENVPREQLKQLWDEYFLKEKVIETGLIRNQEFADDLHRFLDDFTFYRSFP